MRLFDSHCHLQDARISAQADVLVARALNNDVVRMLCCGSTEADWPGVQALAGRFPAVVQPAYGLHPWYITSRSGSWLAELAKLLDADPTAVVGEIGLDHALPQRNDADQMRVFVDQLRLAGNYGRAVSVHCRKAWGALTELFRREPELARGTVIHSYSGPPELVNELTRYGAVLSFSGAITLTGNTRGRRSAVQVDVNHILLETDSPDIAPLNHPPPNEPATLPQVAREIAALRGIDVEEIAEAAWANACRLFGEPATAGK
jgi:TatD DNase family protein